MKTKELSGHFIYDNDGNIIGFFRRDEKSNENIIYKCEKANLDDIAEMFNKQESKI